MPILGQAPSKTSLYNKRKMERQELLEGRVKNNSAWFELKTGFVMLKFCNFSVLLLRHIILKSTSFPITTLGLVRGSFRE